MIAFGILVLISAVLGAAWDWFWGVGIFKKEADPNDWKPAREIATAMLKPVVDSWRAEVERARQQERAEIVAWLRTGPCSSYGHDPRWCQDCETRECVANALEGGEHLKGEEDCE